MFLSVFDVFKIGVGPSSSHTMGPMSAAARFLDLIKAHSDSSSASSVSPLQVNRVTASLHGSLAFTGHGHATDRAVILGLSGATPATLDPDAGDKIEFRIRQHRRIGVPGLPEFAFDPDKDLIFDYELALPGHPNGLQFSAFDLSGQKCISETYYSVGGGFVETEAELTRRVEGGVQGLHDDKEAHGYPYPFSSASEMLEMGRGAGLSIAQMMAANERAELKGESPDPRIDEIWEAMDACIDRGLSLDGTLPGGLRVRRRAKAIFEQLHAETDQHTIQPHVVNDWLSVYAMAVNEENAAGGRVVTSPTNGAAGVVPAVLRYYKSHCIGASHEGGRCFLLTAAAIGGLIKHRASISGAEVGCQGEVGSASAMAAAGLCAALGGSNEQIENAAEIALEHHLGMTCDPAAGLVQVPCIERNALGAIKAVSAASLALRGDGTHFMPLDNCIETMRQTGLDMKDKYKETSQGGIAINLPEC